MSIESDFRLHDSRVRPAEGVIDTPGGEVHISPRTMEVLAHLAEHAGEVISRDQFGDAIWSPAVVTDDALTRCISELRRVLGDRADSPRFIRTVPKRGYQLVAPVEFEAQSVRPAQARHRSRSAWLPLAGLTGVLLAAVLLLWPGDTPVEREPSIAVLAFDDLSEDGDQAYFSDGVSEEILNALARIPELKVAGRNSSFMFKGRHHDLREVGRALGVDHVLEGSVRRQEERVRVTAQLIAVDDGFHLWSQTYDRSTDDIFAVQEDISRAVASELADLLGFDPRPLDFQRVDPAAYDLYLQARALMATRRLDELMRAADLFQAAMLVDPDFSAAHSGRARALSIAWQYSPVLAVSDSADAVRARAGRALEIDADNAEALSTLAYLAAVHDRDFERALELNARAVALAPNQASIANFAGDLYRFIGDFDRMLEWEGRARELEPLHAFQVSDLALSYYVVQDFETALHWAREALALDDESIAALNVASKSAMRLGDFETARELLERLRVVGFANAAYSHAEIDAAEYGPDPQRDSYQALIEAVVSSPYPKMVPAARVATLYGEHERAADLLERALARGDPFMTLPYRYLPAHWPDHPRIQAALAHPNLASMWAIRREHMPEDTDPIR